MDSLTFKSVQKASFKESFELEKKMYAIILAKPRILAAGVSVTNRDLQSRFLPWIDPVMATYFNAFGGKGAEVIKRYVERNGGDLDEFIKSAEHQADVIVDAYC